MATWSRVQEAFLEAAELSAAARQEFLEKLAADSSTVAAEVDSLLAADYRAGDFLGKPAVPTDVRRGAGLETTSTPESIGPYRVIERLGSGGMSDVFLAEREDDDFSHRVAVKLIRGELARHDFVRRFELERQILARLAHPNIAPLLDGGATEEGLPYLVMERVEGAPIDHFCDGNRLTIDERLELFLAVCSAVQYAHRNLIVHRDIKTGNILVTADGVPKLLDFGIAKLLNPESFPLEVERTATRLRPMTPYYASPEQIENGVITTATDVYSLGVLLCRLLTGEYPYRYDDRTPRAVEEKTLQTEPDNLVDALARADQELDELAAERSTTPNALRKVLGGDLNLVVAMALRKEPERRYESVGQLAMDIVNHRQGLPVVAHRDGLVYRVRKFVGRNRAASALSGLLLVVLAVFGAAMAVQAGRLARERDQVQLERDRADQVISLLQESFRVADPLAEGAADVGVKEVLERGRQRVQTELAEQPLVQVELMEVIGSVFRNLGAYSEAQDIFRDALDVRMRATPGDDRAIAGLLDQLGNTSLLAGDHAAASVQLEEALARRRSTLDADAEAIGRSFHSLGKNSLAVGELERAEEHLRESVRIGRASQRPGRELSVVIGDLAILLGEVGKYDESESLLREALDICEDNLPPDSPFLADALNNLAVYLGIVGRYEEAEPLLRRSLRIREAKLGPDHPDVPQSYNNLAQLLRRKGDLPAAERAYREAMRSQATALGPTHPRVAVYENNLAYLLSEKGDLPGAERLFRSALKKKQAALGVDSSVTVVTLIGLGGVYLEQRRVAEAIPVLADALRIASSTFGNNHWKVHEARSYLGACLFDSGDELAAVTMMEESAESLSAVLGPRHRRTVAAGERLSSRRSR